MLFSVIIPVYNIGSLIERCVLSIVEQPGDDYEIILVDDGSTDIVSAEICDSLALLYPHKVSVIHKTNGGPGDARNEGIKRAHGEYYCFVDGDDYVSSDYLKLLREKVIETRADIVQFGYYIELNGEKTDCIMDALPCEETDLGSHPAFLTQAPLVWDRIWNRRLFDENRILFPVNVWYEDLRTVPKLFSVANSVVSIPEYIYIYMQRDGSIMHNNNTEKNEEIIDAIEDVVKWFEDQRQFEKYYNHLSKLAVFQILILASARVARVDPRHHLLTEFRDYVDSRFPNWENNPLLSIRKLPRYYRIMLWLVQLGWFDVIYLLYKAKSLSSTGNDHL